MIKPIQRSTLYNDVLKQMILAIKGGFWKPGEKIPSEIALAKKFQVSRNSIREAMKSLTLFSVVESKPGLGTFISSEALRQISNTELIKMLSYSTTTTSFIELMEVRMLLETQIAYWAAERATEKNIEVLRKLIEEQKKLEYRDSAMTEEDLAPHLKFHETISKMAKNRLARKLLDSMRGEVYSQRHKYLDLPLNGWNQMIAEHEAIMQHIANHDPEKARETMHNHLAGGIQRVIKKNKLD